VRASITWLLPGVFLALSCSCAQKEQPSRKEAAGSSTSASEKELLQERREKDIAFRSGSGSPLPEKDRTGFPGLEYYAFNAALQFRVELNRYPVPARIRIGTNTGEVRNALRYGYFEFEIQGRAYRLQAFRMEGEQGREGPSLFIPFRDATSGTETYAAGRYLDLPENTSGVYDLDFNRAYNPYCAYREDFSCPVPPPENTLPVAIRAGEKTYPGSWRIPGLAHPGQSASP